MPSFLRAKETGLLAVILLLSILLAAFGGRVTQKTRDPVSGRVVGQVEVNKFLQRINIDSILKNSSWTAIMAVGATIVIIAGGIDLSIGSIYCLAAVMGAMLLRCWGPTGSHPGISPTWAITVGILATALMGSLCGAVNGGLVVALRLHPFIITLGTMSIFRGIAFVTTEAQAVTDFPPVFGEIFRYSIGDFTIAPIGVVLLVVGAGHVFLRHTVAGRSVYAIGGNETASVYSGVRVGRMKLRVFTIAGLTGGIAAVVTLGTFGSADSSTGRGYELDVIAAAVVGGASLTGGRGTACGALLGAIIIQLINNGIIILERPDGRPLIDQNYTEIIKGAVIILAVLFDRLSAKLSERKLLRR